MTQKIEDKILQPVDLGQVETNQPVKTQKVAKKSKPVILKDVAGKAMKEEYYFFSTTEDAGKAPVGFNDVCGFPVEREDLLSVFNKVFDPKDGFLFYKTADKEVYIIIVPLKNSVTVTRENNAIDGDFQKHAISFIVEGSVNLDTLKSKLKRITKFVKYTDR